VFGWDDEQFTRYFMPAMSTVRHDREALGRQAMLSLLAQVRGEPQPPVKLGKLFELVPRGSSGPAPR
jgi:DNA-binding LacI/PurR family transcriptional regulator